MCGIVGGMGKTSVYLPQDLAERVRASGVPMAELIRRGLDAGAPPPLEEVVRRAVRAELDAREAGGGRDDTRSRSRSADTDGAARDGSAGESTARDAVPRAAGAASSRGAQPPGRRRKTGTGAGQENPPADQGDAGEADPVQAAQDRLEALGVKVTPASQIARPEQRAHALNCKCLTCKPVKGS